MFNTPTATSIIHLIGITTFFTSAYAAPIFPLHLRQDPSTFSDSNTATATPTTDSNTTTIAIPTNTTTDTTTASSNTTNTLPPIPLGTAADLLNTPDLKSQLRRSAQFTNAAYCSSATVQTWTCGPTCDVLGNITVLYTGGTNQLIPDYYIAHDPSTDSIVLAQQGTDPSQIQSLLVDAQLIPVPLNSTYFPTAPSNTLVHTGFQDAFLRTVEDVQREVQWAVEDFSVNKVLVTGHSLGAAIGVMNGMFLTQLFEGSGVNVTTQVFGLPRAGNSVWADFVDETIGPNFIHMHLNHDPIPTVPPRGLFDYTHPSNEVFDPFTFDPAAMNGTTTRDGSTAVFCPGRENENCSAGNALIADNILDHLGPYLTVDIGSFSCPN